MRGLTVTMLVVVAICLGTAGGAHGATTVRVVETYPVGQDVVLARNQNFYLRLAFVTDTPVAIWATPYFRGVPVKAGSNPSRTYQGTGETLGWFFFMRPGDEVDEIRITAGDGSRAGTPVVATYRARVVAGVASTPSQPPPAWVADMAERERLAQREEFDARMRTPPGVGDAALGSAFMLAILALGLLGFAAPAWGLWRWRGPWRVAATVPAVAMGFMVMRIMVGVARDATSHNLWPFEILLAGVSSAVFMGALWLVRTLAGARR